MLCSYDRPVKPLNGSASSPRRRPRSNLDNNKLRDAGKGARANLASLRGILGRVAARFLGICAFVWLLVGGGAVVASGQQSTRVTDKAVDDAIGRAVTYLNSQRRESGHWEVADKADESRYWAGDSALAILALLTADEDARKEDMARTLDWLAGQSIRATYVYSLRAQCLSLVRGEKFRKQLASDADWLVRAMKATGPWAGAYGYLSPRDESADWYDNSNSQFGVLGVWMATEAGARVDGLSDYWPRAEAHWLKLQKGDGGWSYQQGGESTGSMTVAGLSSLYVVLDRGRSHVGAKRNDDAVQALDRGLDWLSRHFSVANVKSAGEWQYYYMYGLERASRASGKKFLADKDWFQIVARELIQSQHENGSWGAGLRDTAFATLFLGHTRAPIFVNKLEHGDDWNVQFRDAAGITRYASHTFERLFNWQSMSLGQASVDDLMESPLLYLCGGSGWEFDDDERAKLAEFSRRGGTILAVAEKSDAPFAESMRKLSALLFPDKPLTAITRDHPLVNGRAHFPLDGAPQILEARDAIRSRLFLVIGDVAKDWNQSETKLHAVSFQLGCNLYNYVTDRTALRSRLSSSVIALESTVTRRTIRVARIKHGNGWDVEPYGWERLAAYMNNYSGTKLEVVDGVTLDSPEMAGFKIAHLSGVRGWKPTAAELAGLRRFLTGGGTLIADPAMGTVDFLAALEDRVGELLVGKGKRLSNRDAVLVGESITDAGKLTGVEYRRSVRQQVRGREFPPIRGFELGERWAVLYCPLDLSVSMMGAPVFDCAGVSSQDALRIMRNLLLYANLSTAEKAKLWSGSKGP